MITVIFWACLISSGACEQKTIVYHGVGLMGCSGPAPQSAAQGWLEKNPEYELKITEQFPVACVHGRGAAL